MSVDGRTPRAILLMGFTPTRQARVAAVLDRVGHRVHPAANAAETSAILDAARIDLALADLEGPFAEVLAAIEVLRAAGRPRRPLLGVGSVSAVIAMTDALRALGLAAFIPSDATPQELIFRVHQVLYAEHQTATPKSPRVPVNLAADFDGLVGRAEGRVLNLSATGLFLSTDQLLPVNRTIAVRVTLLADAEPIAAKCRVVWTNGGGDGQRYFRGMGLQFLEMPPAGRRQLQTFLMDAFLKARGESPTTRPLS